MCIFRSVDVDTDIVLDFSFNVAFRFHYFYFIFYALLYFFIFSEVEKITKLVLLWLLLYIFVIKKRITRPHIEWIITMMLYNIILSIKSLALFTFAITVSIISYRNTVCTNETKLMRLFTGWFLFIFKNTSPCCSAC